MISKILIKLQFLSPYSSICAVSQVLKMFSTYATAYFMDYKCYKRVLGCFLCTNVILNERIFMSLNLIQIMILFRVFFKNKPFSTIKKRILNLTYLLFNI